jgi:hypothetical protein
LVGAEFAEESHRRVQVVGRVVRWEYEGRDTTHRGDDQDDGGLKEFDGNLRWSRKDRYH